MAWDGITERQGAWFAAVRDGLERETGRSFEDWIAIARTCPETKPRARLAWMKAQHGLGQNRASVVFATAFPDDRTPEQQADALWHDAEARAIFEAIRAAAAGLEGVTIGQRKAFTAFSRRVQFAAARPKGARVRLALAVTADAGPMLVAATPRDWSDRLVSEVLVDSTEQVPALRPLIEQAWSRS